MSDDQPLLNPVFLDVELVLRYHAAQLAAFGGGDGVRDAALLTSAVAQPEATFDGAYLHVGLHAMAAAYLFHIVQDHPFVDGNKRTGYICALAFLELNDLLTYVSDELYHLTIAVASSRLTKDALAEALRRFFPASATPADGAP